jgi:hypothetical protein
MPALAQKAPRKGAAGLAPAGREGPERIETCSLAAKILN